MTGVAVYRLLEISSCSENIPLILIRIQCLLFDSHDMIEAYGRKTDIETNYHSGRCTLQALRRWPWLFNFLLPWSPCPSLAHALRSLHWKQPGLCKAIVLSPLTLSLPKDWLVLRQRFLCRNVENSKSWLRRKAWAFMQPDGSCAIIDRHYYFLAGLSMWTFRHLTSSLAVRQDD
jgi:hypothetical protein